MKRRAHPFVGGPGVTAMLSISLILILFIPSATWAWWSSTSSPAQTSLTLGTITTPQNVACTTVNQSGLAALARVTWKDDPNATSYLVTIRSGSTTATTTVTNPQIDITLGLLGGLVGGLLDLLLGGTPLQLSVQAQHGWTSDASTTISIQNATLLNGYLLGGIRCS